MNGETRRARLPEKATGPPPSAGLSPSVSYAPPYLRRAGIVVRRRNIDLTQRAACRTEETRLGIIGDLRSRPRAAPVARIGVSGGYATERRHGRGQEHREAESKGQYLRTDEVIPPMRPRPAPSTGAASTCRCRIPAMKLRSLPDTPTRVQARRRGGQAEARAICATRRLSVTVMRLGVSGPQGWAGRRSSASGRRRPGARQRVAGSSRLRPATQSPPTARWEHDARGH